MSDKIKIKDQKRPFDGESDVKSPKKRRSSERRFNAKFIAVCETCGLFIRSTVNEVSLHTYEHMCDSSSFDTTSCKEAIKHLEKRIEMENSKEVLSVPSKSSAPKIQRKRSPTMAAKPTVSSEISAPKPPPPPPMPYISKPTSNKLSSK